MKEFLLILRTEGNVWTDLSPEQLQEHMKHGTAYIGDLMKQGVIKSAQPLDRGSRLVTQTDGMLKDGPFNESKEVVAGYFHIVANDMEAAVAIAKANPIFNDIPTQIEVHPIKSIAG
jgi:hypothetical protein